MIIKRKFITFYTPGTFFPESVTQEVQSYDIPRKIPRDVYAFQFSETSFSIEGGEEFRGKTEDKSSRHYIGSVVHVDDIPNTDQLRILRGNITSNSPTKEGIKTHLGNWQIFNHNSVVHSPSEFEFSEPLIWKNIKSEAA